MASTEIVPANEVEVVEPRTSLYDTYDLQIVDFGAGPVLLTPEGQAIFSGHARMNKAQHLASHLGYLIYERMKSPLEETVTVIDLSDQTNMTDDQQWLAHQGVWRTVNFLDIEGVDMISLDEHIAMDEKGYEVKIQEVEMPNGGFVSTYLGSTSCRVLLTPESVLPTR